MFDDLFSDIFYWLTLLESSKKSICDSSLVEWTSEEVQKWFSVSNYSKHTQKFDGLNGKDLACLTEVQFKVRCPEMGDVIYNAVQEFKEKGKFRGWSSLTANFL